MAFNFKRQAEKYGRQRVQRRRWQNLLGILGCIVVFCTTYALILPAITLENDAVPQDETEQKTYYCGKEEHQHTDECYGKKLICENASEEHQHTDECYERKLTCGQEESEGHTHSDSCYTDTEVLVCGKEEHTHTLECESDPEADVGEAESWMESASVASSEETNRADKVVAVAQSQIGYRESTVNFEVIKTTNADGTVTEVKGNGYTFYGDKYKLPYGDWCAMFVSFCVDYAGIPDTEFPRNPSCAAWVTALKGKGLYANIKERNFTPVPGDIVFFDINDDGEADHVGIVESVTRDDYGTIAITTIEGNVTRNGVDVVGENEYTYNLNAKAGDNSGSIIGYGVMPADLTVTPTSVNRELTLNMYTCTYDSSVTDNQVQRYLPGKAYMENLQDAAWEYMEDGKHYYLIPVSNFEAAFEDAGYEFDADAACPFRYGQDENVVRNEKVNNDYWQESANDLELAGYELYNGDWYVQLQATDETYRENIYYAKLNKATDTVSPSNAVINLFDYWLTERDANDYVPYTGGDYSNSEQGINADHPLKFICNWSDATINNNTIGDGVIQGIVQNRLGEDGYPCLTGDLQPVGVSRPEESLAYLFDPNYEGPENAYRAAYANAQNLLAVDQDGYFWFDAAKRGAEFNESTGSFTVYDTPVVVAGGGSPFGQFFPFEDAHQSAMQSSLGKDMQHYFGMTLTTSFIQQYGGHTNANRDSDTIFTFSGDDDVWIFIDGVLVADLGGIHSANSVTINFATGDVTIDGVYTVDESGKGSKVETTTTIYKQFLAAEAHNTVAWSTEKDAEGNPIPTFADGTTHTLNFYYMERGNWDSTMSLRYNLSEIPPTAIYKVDQYGDEVEGATFAVYAADNNYNMLSGKGGKPVGTLPAEYSYNYNNGDIVDADGTVIAEALYMGTTDKKGQMVFRDEKGSSLSLKDIEERFGSQFILKEIGVPDGYRLVSNEIHLRIAEASLTESGGVLLCDDTRASGVWASSTLQVSATNDLYVTKDYSGAGIKKESYYVAGENGSSNTINGTLFGVVFKYTGPEGGSRDLQEYWTPVYGSDMDGYQLVPEEDKIAAAIEAAKLAEGYGHVVFSPSSSGSMQVTLENLPGDIMTYNRMMENSDKAEYSVGYYWTSAGSLSEANTNNTYRVITGPDEDEKGFIKDQSYKGFTRTFGANIRVPNLINRLFVQKKDESGALINGATFALYNVKEEGDQIYYVADEVAGEAGTQILLNADGTATVESGNGTYTTNKEDGVITVKMDGGTTYTITPVAKDTTSYQAGENGTADFQNLKEGTYYIREIAAPAGYKLNPTEVMVLVTEDAIYANAGTADDDVTVARGPGYIVSTLDQFASAGKIDNTLTWIYECMRISDESKTFNAYEDYQKWKYLKENNSAVTAEEKKDALTVHLKYDTGKGANTLFNYTVNDEWYEKNNLESSDVMRRLYTTVGWSYYEIYQDYAYGSEQTRNSETNYETNYENWEGEEIANLFSRSVYVQVTDKAVTDVKITKVDMVNPSKALAGAAFQLYNAEGKYYKLNANGVVSWVDSADDATFVKTDANGLATFTNLPDGDYYLVETAAPEGYHILEGPVTLKIERAKVTVTNGSSSSSGLSVSDGVLDKETNKYKYTVTVPNSTGYELPDTGGAGTQLYTWAGLLLLLGGMSLLLYRIKKLHGKEEYS